ncbi:MAG: hypothetical protein IPL39_09830 [Opitutaceae bacterium]|nr:hypothetical protein [Opitutaceae bacterium]
MKLLILTGTWLLSLGSPEPLIPQNPTPPPAAAFTGTIELRGTTETRGKGELNPDQEATSLTRVRKFEGPAWYRRDIDIPTDWAGRRLQLRLERTKFTQVWHDHPFGSQLLAGTPPDRQPALRELGPGATPIPGHP